jgi:hypothetical protein
MGIVAGEAVAVGHGRMNDLEPLGFAVVALVAEFCSRSREHPLGRPAVGIVAAGTAVLENRVDVFFPLGLAVVALGAELGSGGDEHPLGLAGVGVVAGGAVAVGGRGMEDLFPDAGIVVTGEAESGAALREHSRGVAGMGIVAGGAPFLESRVDIHHSPGLLLMAAVAQGRPFVVEKVLEIALMGAVTADAAVLESAVRVGFSFRFAVMTLSAELAPGGGILESTLFSGVLLAGGFVADAAFLGGDRSVNELRLPHDGMAGAGQTPLPGDGARRSDGRQNDGEKYRKNPFHGSPTP